MIYETTITIHPEDEKNTKLLESQVLKQLAVENKKVDKNNITAIICKKKSIDARKGQIKFHLRYAVYENEKPEDSAQFKPCWKNTDGKKSVIIIGSGPAGLFAALKLLEEGIKPIIIERGSETSKRKVDIAEISKTGKVSNESNYCFGEGGAGTFSDGKLFTRSNKRGNIERILSILNYHGAVNEILSDAHPHIGTDKLPAIINSMIATIRKFGGEVYFDKKCTNLLVEKNGGNQKVVGVVCGDEKFYADKTILATGHSAIDIYQMIFDLAGKDALEAKTFAVGVRVEHPREVIDKIQYHGQLRTENLPAAEYRLTCQVEDRGVYSFCMCPGGVVVPSSSGENQIVVNGMSPSSRNTKWSNSAIVVEVRPEDLLEEFSEGSKTVNDDPLVGLRFRTWLEEETYKQGNGQQAPAQRLEDFINEKKSNNLPETSYTPGVVSSRIDQWMPPFIATRLAQAFETFNNNMHGFICSQALLIASETRTSTPVRIVRNKDSFESPVLQNLFPCGEGSGYSGGIVSSEMDGENTAAAIIKTL